MANNPVPDQGQEFLKSGMTLITDPRSDKYLNMARKRPSCLLYTSDAADE